MTNLKSRRNIKRELIIIGFAVYVSIVLSFGMLSEAPFLPLMIMVGILLLNVIRLRYWPMTFEVDGEEIRYKMLGRQEETFSFSEIQVSNLHLLNPRNAFLEMYIHDKKVVLAFKHHSNMKPMTKLIEDNVERLVLLKKDGSTTIEFKDSWENYLTDQSFLSYLLERKLHIVISLLVIIAFNVLLFFISPVLLMVGMMLLPGLISYFQTKYLQERFVAFVSYMVMWLFVLPLSIWSVVVVIKWIIESIN